jgi:hypothetical protein
LLTMARLLWLLPIRRLQSPPREIFSIFHPGFDRESSRQIGLYCPNNLLRRPSSGNCSRPGRLFRKQGYHPKSLSKMRRSQWGLAGKYPRYPSGSLRSSFHGMHDEISNTTKHE